MSVITFEQPYRVLRYRSPIAHPDGCILTLAGFDQAPGRPSYRYYSCSAHPREQRTVEHWDGTPLPGWVRDAEAAPGCGWQRLCHDEVLGRYADAVPAITRAVAASPGIREVPLAEIVTDHGYIRGCTRFLEPAVTAAYVAVREEADLNDALLLHRRYYLTDAGREALEAWQEPARA
jgi:hypothetical protein